MRAISEEHWRVIVLRAANSAMVLLEYNLIMLH